MHLRKYKNTDANIILSWIKNEREFRLWSADRYGDYPILPEDITNNYISNMQSSFYPLTLEDDGKIIGHLIIRKPNENEDVMRLGFIIVDRSIRGKGYGRKIIEEAIKYSQENFNIHNFSLGVFTNNESAYYCYKAVGFEQVGIEKDAYQFHDESWDCAELVLKR